MVRQCKKTKIILILIVLMVMGMTAVCLAVEEGTESINDTTVSQIKPIPETGHERSHDFGQDVGRYYDFIGTVDDVQIEGIVVGDSYMKFAPNAKVSGAKTGDRVGILLNGDGDVVLCEPYKKNSR